VNYNDFKIFYDNQSFHYDKNNAICYTDPSAEGDEEEQSKERTNFAGIVMPVRKITELYEMDGRNTGTQEQVLHSMHSAP
jgi:hypothetical protein